MFQTEFLRKKWGFASSYGSKSEMEEETKLRLWEELTNCFEDFTPNGSGRFEFKGIRAPDSDNSKSINYEF